MVFILAVDKSQLEASAKVLYGNDLDFENYYHRFAYANVSLPRPDDLKLFIKNLFEKRIRLKRDYGIDFIFDESMELSLIDIMDHLSIRLRIELREIEHVFRIFSYLMMQKKKENKKEDSRIVFNKIIIMLFLIMLSFSKIGKEMYVKLGRQEVDPKEFMIWLQTNMDINFDFATLGRIENFIYFLINKYNENEAADLMYAQGKYKGTRDQFTQHFYSTYASILGERAIPKVQPVKQIHDKINLWKNIIED